MQHQKMIGQEPEVMALALLCKRINSSASNRILDLIRSRDKSILDLSIDPSDYSSAQQFKEDYLVTKFLSKWKGFSSWFQIDTRAVAVSDWKVAEDVCAETNKRLKYHNFHEYNRHGYVNDVFRIAREKIYDILGPLYRRNILEECEWTNGATARTKYGTPLGTKISKPIAVTPTALVYLRACVESDPHWASCFLGRLPDGPCSLLNAYEIWESNRFLTVPKSAKTDRVIAAEPAGNLFLQKGVGNYLKARLARHGIRLSDQSINQSMAQRAYRDKLATLDLKAASDTISFEIIRALLPLNWFEFLNDLRSKSTLMDGKHVRLNKFSSMGNAFTFELETLVFYSLCYAVAVKEKARTHDVSAYGDDLIVPQQIAPRVMEVLNFAGFTINQSKSFTTGDFYESCGYHYFKGIPVTPIYQKEEATTLQERIRLFNRIYRWGYADGPVLWSCVNQPLRYLRSVFNITEKEVRNGRVPAIPRMVEGDDGYLVDPNWLPRYNPNAGYCCRVIVYRPLARETRAVDALLAYKLRHAAYSNCDPKGRQKEPAVGKGVWVIKTRWIHPWPSYYVSEIEFGSEAERNLAFQNYRDLRLS